MESKTCTKCGFTRSVNDFYRKSRGEGYRSKCKPCMAEYGAARAHLRRKGPKLKRSSDGLSKECGSCHEMKPLEAYSRQASKGDGRLSYCKTCVSAYQAKRRSEMPEHVSEIASRDYQKHKEKRDATQKKWNESNADRLKKIKRRSALKLRPAIRDQRRGRYASDPLYRAAKLAEKDRRRRARTPMSETDKQLSTLYRVVILNDPCFYCGKSGDSSFHVDHYIPIFQGGTDHWWNLVMACDFCNLSKGSKMPQDFIASLR